MNACARRWPATLSATLLVTLLATLLAACDVPEPAPPEPDPAEAPVPAEANHANIASVPLNDEAGAQALAHQRQLWRRALTALLDNPDGDHLAQAGSAWEALYTAFNAHYLSLAANACRLGVPGRLERLDGWPFFPAFVDALPAWPDSGIVNDPALELTASNLRRQQGATSDGEIALGFQPLQLLLFGVPEAPRRPTDFRAGHPAGTVSANAAEEDAAVQVDAPSRRRDYLRLADQQLAADFDALLGGAAYDGHNTDSLRCALRTLDRRLAQLDRQRDATAPEGGLYLPALSIELIDASQPETALSRLSADDNAALREALDKRWPGFQLAVEQAQASGDWAPLREWLDGASGEPSQPPSSPTATRG